MKDKLVRGKRATSPKGFQENISHMRDDGKSMKRATGTAYGEAHLAMDRKRDSMGRKLPMNTDKTYICKK